MIASCAPYQVAAVLRPAGDSLSQMVSDTGWPSVKTVFSALTVPSAARAVPRSDFSTTLGTLGRMVTRSCSRLASSGMNLVMTRRGLAGPGRASFRQAATTRVQAKMAIALRITARFYGIAGVPGALLRAPTGRCVLTHGRPTPYGRPTCTAGGLHVRAGLRVRTGCASVRVARPYALLVRRGAQQRARYSCSLPEVNIVATFRHRRRLRHLQRAYYDARRKNDAVVAGYIGALAGARHAELRGAARLVCVHVGSGGHHIDGWINVDFDYFPPLDLIADAGRSLPLASDSVDRIHSEDFIEHIDLDAGARFLAEAFRVLRPGGIMRLLTPDLRALVEQVYIDRQPRHLRWCGVYLDAHGPCEALNMHLRINGEHRFIYDEELLRGVLKDVGFSPVRRVRWNRSPDRYLRYLDLRDFGLNLFLECVKPSSPPS